MGVVDLLHFLEDPKALAGICVPSGDLDDDARRHAPTLGVSSHFSSSRLPPWSANSIGRVWLRHAGCGGCKTSGLLDMSGDPGIDLCPGSFEPRSHPSRRWMRPAGTTTVRMSNCR